MIQLWKTIASSPFLRIALLSALLSGVACFVIWDHHRVNMDFRQLKALLTDVRWQTAGKDKTLAARFADRAVSITDNDTGVGMFTNWIGMGMVGFVRGCRREPGRISMSWNIFHARSVATRT